MSDAICPNEGQISNMSRIACILSLYAGLLFRTSTDYISNDVYQADWQRRWVTKRTGKPIPRDGTTPTEYKQALAERIRTRRRELGYTIVDVADELSRKIGREIRADSYRQWETIKSVVQIDAILPLCDILRIHVFELLRKPERMEESKSRGKAVA